MTDKRLKILFFGLGSIGRRHAALLKKEYDYELFAVRSGEGKYENDLGIKEYDSFQEALTVKPDLAFITNPTCLHVPTALECAEQGINLFIEKPLSHTSGSLDDLSKLIEKKGLYSYVAFCMRFHPVLQALKEILKDEEVLYAHSTNYSYLPHWRCGIDYRESFASCSEKGGGILLEMMHELDYHHFLFGGITKIGGRHGRASKLEIDCEDYGELLCESSSGVKSSIYLNFFSVSRERKVTVFCRDKTIQGDFVSNTLKVFKEEEAAVEESFPDGFEVMYSAQMKYFIGNHLEGNRGIMNTVPKAASLLRLLLNFKAKNLTTK